MKLIKCEDCGRTFKPEDIVKVMETKEDTKQVGVTVKWDVVNLCKECNRKRATLYRDDKELTKKVKDMVEDKLKEIDSKLSKKVPRDDFAKKSFDKFVEKNGHVLKELAKS